MLLVSFTSTAQYWSVGTDPAIVFEEPSINAKIIDVTSYGERGFSSEIVKSIEYYDLKGFLDVRIFGPEDYSRGFQGFAGIEVGSIFRFVNLPSDHDVKKPSGLGHGMWFTAGCNATLRYMFNENFGVESVLNFKVRKDEDEIYPTDEEERSNGISGRVNFVFII